MPNPIESWRLFIAIELPRDVRHQIKHHIDHLRAQLPNVRASWVREDNLHLTLKFLGDTPLDRIEAISSALAGAANKTDMFEIQIGGCGAFPPRGKPSVLWIGIEDLSGSLRQLHGRIEDGCGAAAIARDSRSFHPHLTIARLREPHGARQLAQLHQDTGFDVLSVRVDGVSLIRSELSSAGSRYTTLGRFEFRAESQPGLR